MGEVVPITQPLTADDKCRLIQSARDDLLGARAIDEQETLTDGEALAWYDAILPQVTDIKVIAGAMDAELTIRRGKLVEEEGELRGDDQKSLDAKNQSSALPNFDPDEKRQRSEDRLIASQEHAVRSYVKNCIKRSKVPTRRAMLRVAYLAKNGGRKPKTKPQAEKKRSAPRDPSRAYQAFDKLVGADRPLSDGEIHALTGMNIHYLHYASVFIPWLRRTKTSEGTRFTIDTELREICEGNRPRPQLSGSSLAQELRTLRSEIKRRRDERELYVKRSNWDHLTARAKFLVELVNWLEGELERVATLL